jgi:hypothetical protein
VRADHRAVPTDPTVDRRLRWTVRLVLYPIAIALIAVAWHQRHASAEAPTRPLVPTPPTWWEGRTTQGRLVAAERIGSTVIRLKIMMVYRCEIGHAELWSLFGAASFRHHGPAATADFRNAGIYGGDLRGTMTSTVRTDAGAQIRGAATGAAAVHGPRRRCATGPVAFRLSRTRSEPRFLL